jgi:hypothetical protein
MENIDSILSLPKFSEVNVGRRRRINDPKAKVLTPLPERKLRGRSKKSDADDNPNSSKPSTSGAEPNETICGMCHGSYSDDVAARNCAQWIQCMFCSRWWHEQCVDNGDSPQFMCIECDQYVELTPDDDSDYEMYVMTVGNTEVQLTSTWHLIFIV